MPRMITAFIFMNLPKLDYTGQMILDYGSRLYVINNNKIPVGNVDKFMKERFYSYVFKGGADLHDQQIILTLTKKRGHPPSSPKLDVTKLLTNESQYVKYNHGYTRMFKTYLKRNSICHKASPLLLVKSVLLIDRNIFKKAYKVFHSISPTCTKQRLYALSSIITKPMMVANNYHNDELSLSSSKTADLNSTAAVSKMCFVPKLYLLSALCRTFKLWLGRPSMMADMECLHIIKSDNKIIYMCSCTKHASPISNCHIKLYLTHESQIIAAEKKYQDLNLNVILSGIQKKTAGFEINHRIVREISKKKLGGQTLMRVAGRALFHVPEYYESLLIHFSSLIHVYHYVNSDYTYCPPTDSDCIIIAVIKNAHASKSHYLHSALDFNFQNPNFIRSSIKLRRFYLSMNGNNNEAYGNRLSLKPNIRFELF
ncbi:hypothetical protein AGLY_009031 [Aphis glycines]|uniref:Uncharacterized protein n=1 Tax=Aphis glycines TaxID=307491 RepID=A0A6G0TK44_APHGL|nr:hypothetical protein AGLY_009031 [Aphis glycines]